MVRKRITTNQLQAAQNRDEWKRLEGTFPAMDVSGTMMINIFCFNRNKLTY